MNIENGKILALGIGKIKNIKNSKYDWKEGDELILLEQTDLLYFVYNLVRRTCNWIAKEDVEICQFSLS